MILMLSDACTSALIYVHLSSINKTDYLARGEHGHRFLVAFAKLPQLAALFMTVLARTEPADNYNPYSCLFLDKICQTIASLASSLQT